MTSPSNESSIVKNLFRESCRGGRGKWARLALLLSAMLDASARGQTVAPGETVPGQALASDDGLITVQIPQGDGWECLRSRQKQADSVLTTIKCRRAAPGEFFFLAAKDYTLNEPSPRSAEELSSGVYRRSYESLYSRVKYLSQGEVKHHGRDAYEVKFDAQHDRLGSVRKIERVLVEGRHILILSGEGNSELFDRMQAAIEQWFATAAFSTLPPLTTSTP
jgi:hypothetical protein